jgi:hypothetical protein
VRRSRILAPAGVAAALLLGACGDDDRSADVATTTTEAAPRPSGLEEVRRTFSAEVDALDMVLTEEGGVIDLETYLPAPEDGTHLSIYLAPRSGIDDQAYLDGILETARALAPGIFERWSAIETFDVCQLPPADDGEGAALTRLDMDRSSVESLDWAALDLPTFLAAARERPDDGIRLYVTRSLREAPAYQEATAAPT